MEQQFFTGGKIWVLRGNDGSLTTQFASSSADPVDCDEPPVAGAEALDLRDLYALIGDGAQFAAAVAGRSLVEWVRENRFCGKCGSPTRRHENPLEKAFVCTYCHASYYPRITPAVITLVTRGEEVLLEHNRHYATDCGTLVAGFIESGESAESAVAREIMEETGIRVKDIRYVGSQPWPFPYSLMLGYRAEWAEGELRPDGDEIDRCAWYRHDALPALPPGMSIARKMIEAWKRGEI